VRDQRPRLEPSFYDRVLRDGDATLSVARYVFENPVRGGLVAEPADYQFSGSSRFTVEQILEAVYWQPPDSVRNHRSAEGLRDDEASATTERSAGFQACR
jgi:hypothetical protein